MQRKSMPYHKYRPYEQVNLPDRTWPDRIITKAPVWCSVDLRDGNQALNIPMDIDEKTEMFNLLVSTGFKEIEVGFPSASQIEYDFVRKIIDEDLIPDDVTIQLLTQAREHLIRRTFDSIKGAKNAIVHMYNSTSAIQRKVVFKKSREEITRLATDAAALMKELRESENNPGIRFQYSPESFMATELDFALDICHAVMDVWNPTADDRMIINLPATVEMSTPNVFADRIEWMCRNIRNRESVIMSVHTHNDRGCAVAASELAVMAGAERIEGALFGNGERTGNMDIVTMALNLFSQGVDPELDFSNIKHVRNVYTNCTRMDVHPRHPYAGELVYTAFSGSHQDAIDKGLKVQRQSESEIWDVPYLLIDPRDVGRNYKSVIRINSQSGKGGIAHVMERDWGFFIPREMQPEFARVIQKRSDETISELSSSEIMECFKQEYFDDNNSYSLKSLSVHSDNGDKSETVVNAVITNGGDEYRISASGNGPISAFVNGIRETLDIQVDVSYYFEHALTQGSNAKAVSYIGLNTGADHIVYGVGIDENVSYASIRAILSAINRIK